MLLNRSVDYFAKNDDFEETNFLNEVLDNPDLIAEFKNYKVDKGEKYSIEDVSSFPISNKAVTEARKKFKKDDQPGYKYSGSLRFHQPRKRR